jgi:hypothetical protein
MFKKFWDEDENINIIGFGLCLVLGSILFFLALMAISIYTDPASQTPGLQISASFQSEPKPPVQTAAPNSNIHETRSNTIEESKPKIESKPFTGHSYYEGVITSVYFYPSGQDAVDLGGGEIVDIDVPVTHIKFDYNDSRDIWLCGDQRSHIKLGSFQTLIMSFESPCVSKWRFEK